MTVMTLTDLGRGLQQIDGDGGFETTTFSGFDRLVVRPPDGVVLRTLPGFDGDDRLRSAGGLATLASTDAVFSLSGEEESFDGFGRRSPATLGYDVSPPTDRRAPWSETGVSPSQIRGSQSAGLQFADSSDDTSYLGDQKRSRSGDLQYAEDLDSLFAEFGEGLEHDLFGERIPLA